ncbi:hypothetical protein COJ48_18375 [Bacillus cereus]|uniref:hypothetical protein n=1 Tax=Bacillus paramycoides TaxID=2026194 RepID=UPI000BF6F713|nr:hypothetical protein [Bacillus paramycoides]NWK72611.1 hypothetical protein [Bacillus paramycoides]PFM62712.1 hypothetical protein COJ48_18375 [Bacillus cereus]PGP88745.1 hypothetical protein CN997_02470 [Bacillus cereus]
MDVLVRGIDPSYIKEIDRRCELISTKLNRKYSRQEYLQNLIRNEVERSLFEFKQDQFDTAVKNLSVTLERQTNMLQEYIGSNNELIQVLAEK